jgi:SOS-response transcriptional repressor LexA
MYLGPCIKFSAPLKHKSSALLIDKFSGLLFNKPMDTIEDTRVKRLKLLRDECGSNASLSKTIEISEAQLSQWINRSPDSKSGKPRSISSDSARHIEKKLGKQPGWLDQPIQEEIFDNNVELASPGTRRIPVISYVQAGNMTEAIDPYAVGGCDKWLLTDLELSSKAFALVIRGDSMLPEFRNGDNVIIDPAVQPQPGDYVVAKNHENEATFKKYRPRGINERGEQVFELVPLNEDYPSMRSDLVNITIIGTMVEHRRYRRR